MKYDRKVLVEVLIYHWPTSTSGCGCGWARLGHSHAEHVADVYEASVVELPVMERVHNDQHTTPPMGSQSDRIEDSGHENA